MWYCFCKCLEDLHDYCCRPFSIDRAYRPRVQLLWGLFSQVLGILLCSLYASYSYSSNSKMVTCIIWFIIILYVLWHYYQSFIYKTMNNTGLVTTHEGLCGCLNIFPHELYAIYHCQVSGRRNSITGQLEAYISSNSHPQSWKQYIMETWNVKWLLVHLLLADSYQIPLGYLLIQRG